MPSEDLWGLESRFSMDSATIRTSPPTIPSTPHLKSTSRVSQCSDPTLHKAQRSTSSVHGDSQAVHTQEARAGGKHIGVLQGFPVLTCPWNAGLQMPPPKVPIKHQPPTPEDNNRNHPLFGDSPLAGTPPQKMPACKRRQAKAAPSNPARRSQRAISRVATDKSILSLTS